LVFSSSSFSTSSGFGSAGFDSSVDEVAASEEAFDLSESEDCHLRCWSRDGNDANVEALGDMKVADENGDRCRCARGSSVRDLESERDWRTNCLRNILQACRKRMGYDTEELRSLRRAE
jgi:hypothetical protein